MLESVYKLVSNHRLTLAPGARTHLKTNLDQLVALETSIDSTYNDEIARIVRDVYGPSTPPNWSVRVLARLRKWCIENGVESVTTDAFNNISLVFGRSQDFFRLPDSELPVVERIRLTVEQSTATGGLRSRPTVLYLQNEAQDELNRSREMSLYRSQVLSGSTFASGKWEGMEVRPLGIGRGVAVAYETQETIPM